MANPSVTYTFTNGTVADATQVNQNFTDLINGLTDGSKSLNIDAITAAGKATFNGAVDLGNATGDVITVNGAFAGTGGDASATQKGLVTTGPQTLAGIKTFSGGIVVTARDGTAVGVGDIGEVFGTARLALSGTTVSGSVNIGTFSNLTAGNWIILTSAYFAAANAGNRTLLSISETSGTHDSNWQMYGAASTSTQYGNVQSFRFLNITSTKNIYVVASGPDAAISTITGFAIAFRIA